MAARGRARRASISSSWGPRRRWSTGSSTSWPRAASRPSARRARSRSSRAPRRSPRRSWRPRAWPPRRGRRSTTVEDGMAAIERYPVVLKFDGLAAGKGVVIAADEAQARGGARGLPGRGALRRRRAWWSRSARGRGALAAGAVRRRDAPCRWRPRRTTSASSTATRARTPAAWAPTRRCPASTARAWRSTCAPSTSRWSTRCATAAPRSTAASTRA